jgi:hypothetical protein
MHELAYFRGNDEPSLVAATLACSVCLSADVEWSLEVADFDGWCTAAAAGAATSARYR